MTAMAAETTEFAEGLIDFCAGTWVCGEHDTTMRVDVPCSFCAVEEHGVEILEELALPRL